MKRISERDYGAPLPDLNRGDEIGGLSRSVALVTDRLQEFDDRLLREKEQAQAQQFAVDELAAGLQRLAGQDFSQTLDQEFDADLQTDYGNAPENRRRIA